jgi:hypothetical protein
MEKSESEREIRPRYKTHNPITPLLFSLLETDLTQVGSHSSLICGTTYVVPSNVNDK